MELDTVSHNVMVVSSETKAAAPTPDRPNPRPALVPGSFRLTILGH